jgi:hypothetical protein
VHRSAGTGIHAGSYAESWNGVWEAFFQQSQNANAGAPAILAQLAKMMNEFGL